MRSDRVGERDDTTRYLCAAAHLDDRFADVVIREFLTEPTRAVPPVAGVRAGAVLAEAVAARARRKVRDALLVTLLAGVLVTLSLSIVIAWLVIGVTAFVTFLWSEPHDRAGAVRRLLPAVAGGVVAGVLLVVLFQLGSATTSYSIGDPDLTPAALAVLLLAVVLAVLLVDEFVVWHHIEDRFPRGHLVPDPAPDALSPQVRRVFLFGAKQFLVQLRRQLHQRQRMYEPCEPDPDNGAAPPPAPVIVARGYRMFVGAGEPYGPWSLAVPLRRRADAEQALPLCTADLYERVTNAMASLRDAADLSPSGRFAELRVSEQVVVAAEELIDNLELAGDFLSGPGAAPYPLLRGQRVRELRDKPLEWARYYRRFQVETWDRDFVVSAFLHLAVSDTTLYVEWTPCVLLPLRKEYRAIDAMPDTPLLPVARAVLRFLTLPLSVPGRLRSVFSTIRPQRHPGGTLSPAMYGVAHSLRELAADTDVQNYFQLADRGRYLKVLESRLTLALVEALEEAGYEVTALEQQAATVANNSMYIQGGSFAGNVVAGSPNMAGPVTPTPMAGAAS